MAGLIKMAGGKNEHKRPIIIGFMQFGEIDTDSFSIKYTAIDESNKTLTHYLYINGEKKDISNEVGSNIINREFSYTLNNLKPETEYQLQLEVFNGSSTTQSSIIKVKTKKILIYGVRVMENNSNPSTCCTYVDDAIGIQVANNISLGGWSNVSLFNKVKIVGFKSGNETKEINPNNKTQYIDGSTVPQDVDVMVKIPKFYWDFTNITNGYELRISEKKFNNTCDCYAHKIEGIEKDYIYVGAYQGYVENGKLRSKSGTVTTVMQNITTFRQQAQAVGDGYQLFNWFTLLSLQILYLIAYKNLDSQTVLGLGLNSGPGRTGGTNTKGMIFGSQNAGEQMCFLGIEDFYGNCRQWIDGMSTDNSFNVFITQDNKNFNNDRVGFKNIGKIINTSQVDGFLTKVAHTNEGGFFPKDFNGSTKTYYCDHDYCHSLSFGIFGGYYQEFDTGSFYLNVSCKTNVIDGTLGARLCYLG